MSDENYLTADELRGLAAHCDALTPLWDVLTSGPKGGVAIDQDGESLHLNVYDSNGEPLGRIDWADSGAAFYPKVN